MSPASNSPTVRGWIDSATRVGEQAVLSAFISLVARQTRNGGGLTPEVELAIADSIALADLTAGSGRERQRPLAKAVRRASRSLDTKPGPDGPALTKPAERYLGRQLRHLTVTADRQARLDSPAVSGVINAFHRLFYDDRNTWHKTKWQGITTLKCPLDLWLYQEIIHDLEPGLIIETGSAYGGSAAYLGWLCDVVGKGKVVSVDIAPYTDNLPVHPRVTFLRGSSTDPQIVDQVQAMITPGEPVMVILDSDHSEAHVRDELAAYADLVTPGSYLIVEDTNVNGHPAHPGHGPGPMEAVNWFITARPDFRIDRSKQRYFLTLNPRGYLKKAQA